MSDRAAEFLARSTSLGLIIFLERRYGLTAGVLVWLSATAAYVAGLLGRERS